MGFTVSTMKTLLNILTDSCEKKFQSKINQVELSASCEQYEFRMHKTNVTVQSDVNLSASLFSRDFTTLKFFNRQHITGECNFDLSSLNTLIPKILISLSLMSRN